MNRVKTLTSYGVILGILVGTGIFIAPTFPLWLLALVVVARGIIWASGWRPIPFHHRNAAPVPSIPCFIGKPRLDGTWINDGQFGTVPASGWWIYRHFDPDNNLAYVGKTNSPRRRFGQHVESGKALTEHWTRWELYQCSDEAEMDELEKVAILYNNPATNKERWRLERYLGEQTEYIDTELAALEPGELIDA